MKNRTWADAPISRQAFRLLWICFPVILVEFILITARQFLGEFPTRLYAARLYHAMLEYIFLDMTIVVIGAFLLDLTARTQEDR